MSGGGGGGEGGDGGGDEVKEEVGRQWPGSLMWALKRLKIKFIYKKGC